MSAITAILRYLICYHNLDRMLRYLATRLLYMVPVIWLVVSVVFLLIHLVPGDPIQQMLGENAAGDDVQAAPGDPLAPYVSGCLTGFGPPSANLISSYQTFTKFRGFCWPAQAK
jgi:energy-converting hydrogenase Eha subunit F